MKKLLIDCETGEQTMVDLSQDDLDQQAIDEATFSE
jgi:hypothetical protein